MPKMNFVTIPSYNSFGFDKDENRKISYTDFYNSFSNTFNIYFIQSKKAQQRILPLGGGIGGRNEMTDYFADKYFSEIDLADNGKYDGFITAPAYKNFCDSAKQTIANLSSASMKSWYEKANTETPHQVFIPLLDEKLPYIKWLKKLHRI